MKVCFNIEERQMVQFKLRLRHDGLSQTNFISSIIDLYLEEKDDIIEIVNEIKSLKSLHSKTKISKDTQMHIKGVRNKNRLHISEDERESLFDIIEEVGDL